MLAEIGWREKESHREQYETTPQQGQGSAKWHWGFSLDWMKILPTLLVTAATSVLALLPSRADTYVLTNSQGAMTYEFLTGWTFGSMYPEIISALNTGATSPHSMPSYLKFDLSGLVAIDPDDITSATLRLYLADVAASGFGVNPSETYPVSVNFNLVTGGDWSKATITYGNAPAAGGLVGGVTGIDSVGVWVEIDLTDLVKDWVSGDVANYGLRLTQPTNVRDNTNNSVFALFNSDGATTNRPELVVTTSAVPEPSVSLLMGGTGLFFLIMRRRRVAA